MYGSAFPLILSVLAALARLIGDFPVVLLVGEMPDLGGLTYLLLYLTKWPAPGAFLTPTFGGGVAWNLDYLL